MSDFFKYTIWFNARTILAAFLCALGFIPHFPFSFIIIDPSSPTLDHFEIGYWRVFLLIIAICIGVWRGCVAYDETDDYQDYKVSKGRRRWISQENRMFVAIEVFFSGGCFALGLSYVLLSGILAGAFWDLFKMI